MDPATAKALMHGLQNLLNTAQAVDAQYDRVTANPSLGQYNKQSIINIRGFYDDSIERLSVMSPIMKSIQNIAAAYILNTFQLTQFVNGGRTVRDLTRMVSTEYLKGNYDNGNSIDMISAIDLSNMYGQYIGIESLEDASAAAKGRAEAETKIKNELEEDAKQRAYDETLEKNAAYQKLKAKKEAAENTSHKTANGARFVKLDLGSGLPIGRIIEIDIAGGDKKPVKFNMIMNISPYRVSHDIAADLIKLNTVETFGQRWLRWQAGELNSIVDLAYNSEMITRQKRLMKSDKDGLIAEFIKAKLKGDARAYERLLNMSTGNTTRENVSSSVMILSKEAILQAKAETGIDIAKPGARAEWFRTTRSWVLVVVDQIHERVNYYIDGIETGSEYTFKALETKDESDKKDAGMALTNILMSLSQNKPPPRI